MTAGEKEKHQYSWLAMSQQIGEVDEKHSCSFLNYFVYFCVSINDFIMKRKAFSKLQNTDLHVSRYNFHVSWDLSCEQNREFWILLLSDECETSHRLCWNIFFKYKFSNFQIKVHVKLIWIKFKRALAFQRIENFHNEVEYQKSPICKANADAFMVFFQ